MPLIEVNGVEVSFPFEPYDVQQKYMEKMIECIQKGINGVLESPTGTGKTLCLLCSSLAWLHSKKASIQAKAHLAGEDGNFTSVLRTQLSTAAGLGWNDASIGIPKIIYCSRTHSQLSQAIAELRNTHYRGLKVAILGSRDQLCVHPDVSKETNNSTKLHMCHAKVQARTCYFATNVENKKQDKDFTENGALDIEDLVKLGKKHACCPYYMSRELKDSADLIFMPYNYLLDPKTRKSHGIDVQGNVLIFDEAHNVEKVCEDAASFIFKSSDLALCVDEVTTVMNKMVDKGEDDMEMPLKDKALEDFGLKDLALLKVMLLELEKAVDAIDLPSDGLTKNGSFIYELLAQAEITQDKTAIIIDMVDKLVQYLTTTSASPFARKGGGLQKLSDLLKTAFSSDMKALSLIESVKKCYKVHISEDRPTKKKENSWTVRSSGDGGGRVLNYWCFSPGFGMRDLMAKLPRCVILTSGTLSPLSSFTGELQTPFPVQLENPHIITGEQVWVGVLRRGPDGEMLDSSYANRSNHAYVMSLGQTLVNLARVIPQGLLVFFPSYSVLRSCQEKWQETGVWDKICNQKPIFVEPQTKDAFVSTMEEFYKRVNDPNLKGAIFMAVCRGKVSEGLDFADGNGRAVVITGLPYPPFKDPRVILKQKYLEENKGDRSFEGLSGREWYRLEASRAVNQAVGRVIRHRKDYGAIIFADRRFGDPNFSSAFSSWLQPHIQKYDQFGKAIGGIIKFFKNARSIIPDSKPKSISASQSSAFGTDLRRTLSVASEGSAFESVRSKPMAPSLNTSQSVRNAVVELDDSWNTSDYSGKENKPKASTSASLFSALEARGECIDFNEIPKTSKTAGLVATDAENKEPKRKRIKIVPQYEKEFLEAASTSSTQSKSDMKEEKANKTNEISSYLAKVKSSIPEDEYKAFSSSIKKYRKDKQLTSLVDTFARLFVHDPKRYPLFRGIGVFLLRSHRDEFNEMCEQLTGRGFQ